MFFYIFSIKSLSLPMKNFLKILLMSFVSTFSLNPLYAFDLFSLEEKLDTSDNYIKTEVYGIDLRSNSKTLITEKVIGTQGASPNSFVSPSTGELILTGDDNFLHAYSWESDTWRKIDYSAVPLVSNVKQKPPVFGASSSKIISIGQNSLKLKETATSQEMWATDSSGRIAPINITNGSKLLINGRDVEQSINNVGALSAALTGLPTIPMETNLACGLGTGTHGGDFAFSGGCASKVNEKLSINYAASITIPGQDYAGDFEDTFSARAGFVWKLGKSLKPTNIGSKDRKVIDKKISVLEKDNKLLKAKNNEIIFQNQKLLERLEKLENIALKPQSSSKMISVSTKE